MHVDAADLFCEIYDRFEATRLTPRDVDNWLTDEQVIDIASMAEGQVVEQGSLDKDEVWERIDMAEDRDRRRYAYLQGIDNALLHAHPHVSSFDRAGLTAVAARYVETGRFNTSATPGALLPRFAFPTEGLAAEDLAGTLIAVVRVPSPAWDRTDHMVIPSRSDFQRRDRERGVVFGCVPFLEHVGDLEWSCAQSGSRTFYRAEVLEQDALRERIGRVLRLLDAQGAMIGVLPESSGSEQMLSWWQEEIRAQRPPRESKLRWIFVGTGSVDSEQDPPKNTGILLDRFTGDVLLRQDKLHPFVMSRELIVKWGLSDQLGLQGAQEDIQPGEKLTVAESALGRIVILICEDLARTMTLGPEMLSHGISHVLSPVFSDEIEMHHWEHNKAKDYADQIGAQTIVANSRVIGCNMGESTFGTALAHSPRDNPTIGRTSSPEDIVLLRLSDEAAVNAVARTAGFEEHESSVERRELR